jgi:hypothetical protein
MYRCYKCQKFIDNDWYPCEQHPTMLTELLCPACVDDTKPSLEVKQGGVFTKEQLQIIAQLETESEE